MFVKDPPTGDCVSQGDRKESNVENFSSILDDKGGLLAPVTHLELRAADKIEN